MLAHDSHGAVIERSAVVVIVIRIAFFFAEKDMPAMARLNLAITGGTAKADEAS